MFGDILNSNENIIDKEDSIEEVLEKMSDSEVLEGIYNFIGGFDDGFDEYDNEADNEYFGGYDDEFGYNGKTS